MPFTSRTNLVCSTTVWNQRTEILDNLAYESIRFYRILIFLLGSRRKTIGGNLSAFAGFRNLGFMLLVR